MRNGLEQQKDYEMVVKQHARRIGLDIQGVVHEGMTR